MSKPHTNIPYAYIRNNIEQKLRDNRAYGYHPNVVLTQYTYEDGAVDVEMLSGQGQTMKQARSEARAYLGMRKRNSAPVEFGGRFMVEV